MGFSGIQELVQDLHGNVVWETKPRMVTIGAETHYVYPPTRMRNSVAFGVENLVSEMVTADSTQLVHDPSECPAMIQCQKPADVFEQHSPWASQLK